MHFLIHTTEWLVELYLNEVLVTFKIDTGAEVIAIAEAIAKSYTVGTRYELTECLWTIYRYSKAKQ